MPIKQIQRCCSHLSTKKLLNNVKSKVWWQFNCSSPFNYFHSKSFNEAAEGVQNAAFNGAEKCLMTIFEKHYLQG